MKLLRFAIISLLILPATLAGQRTRPVPVVMISIDGLMPSAYTTPGPAKIPNLRALATRGAWASGVRGVVPTVTYPSHTTLITGLNPADHGIYDNPIFDPEGNAEGAWYWYSEWIKAPTLPQLVGARGVAGAVSWPVAIGMDIQYNVPEFWRSEHIEMVSLLKALSSPRRLLDDVARARGAAIPWPMTDRERTDIAKYILTKNPSLLLVHLVELDFATHDEGPGSARSAAALERIDGYVGELVADIGRRLGPDTTIAVVSDHGFRPTTRELQPNALFKREGLLTASGTGKVTDWQAFYHADGGGGFVYLKRDDPALREQVWGLLERLKADPANGIEVLWTRADLDRLGANPDAAFGLGMALGFYSGVGHDVLLKTPYKKGGHGFAPDNPELYASLIVAGGGVKPRGDLGLIRMTQIAPTLARILGVKLSPKADRPLW